MSSLLIGETGFVGGCLKRLMHFDHLASSANISCYFGREFDTMVVAAGDARKWIANANPEADQLHVEKLRADLARIRARRIIHYSTVDVYNVKAGDEDSLAGNVAVEPYGRHRYALEVAVRAQAAEVCTIRLPGLFGLGLKKNFIYDIKNWRQIAGLHPDACFQWFDMAEIGSIHQFCLENRIEQINVSTEPISVSEVLNRCNYPSALYSPGLTAPRYDVRSRHSAQYRRGSIYMYDRQSVISGILKFLEMDPA